MPEQLITDAADSLRTNDFTRSGYAFSGWNTRADGTGQSFAAESRVVPALDADTTLYAQWIKTSANSLRIAVLQESSSKAAVKVELKQGNKVVSTGETDANGEYNFLNLALGIYNAVVSYDGLSYMQSAELTAAQPNGSLTINLPAGKTGAVVNVQPNTPAVTVTGLGDAAAAERAAGGAAEEAGAADLVELELELASKSAEELESAAPEALEAINNAASGQQLEFYDMSLELTINNGEPAALDEAGSVLEIILPFQTGGRRDITVYRYVNGAEETMTSVAIRPAASSAEYADGNFYVGNGYVAIYTNKLDIYAIGYKDVIPAPYYPPAAEEKPQKDFFVDVPKDSYYYDAVKWAAEKGIAEGIDETHFGPAGETSRALMVYLLWKSFDCPEPESNSCAFTDVDANAYYYKAVLWAAEKGYVLGTDETHFSPDATVTRAQMATLLWRIAGKQARGTAPFVDVSKNEYYYDAVRWAFDERITNGTSATTFAPDELCTRGQTVTFMFRYFEKE